MTSSYDSSVVKKSQTQTLSLPATCFSCTRLNPTTFLIVEDDQWSEMPFIYAKVYDTVLVLIDTGCGGAARDSVELTSLRDFIEEYPVADNDARPLNPGAKRDYAVICTHCHYDHIGAIAQFTDDKSSIWASSNDKTFIQHDLPTTSLCRFVGMKTPEYTVLNWASDGQKITLDHIEDLGLVVYHSPGHTPDELAVTMACGHNTSAADAEEFVGQVEAFLSKVKRGLVEPVDRGEGRGAKLVGYEREDGRISFLGPKHLFDGALVGHCPM